MAERMSDIRETKDIADLFGFDIFQHCYMICGYITCCRECRFLTEDTMTDLMKRTGEAGNEIKDNHK